MKMKKFLLPFIDKSFSFSPKKPFQILAEPGGRPPPRWAGLGMGGRAKRIEKPRAFQTAKEPENKSARTIFWKGKRIFFIRLYVKYLVLYWNRCILYLYCSANHRTFNNTISNFRFTFQKQIPGIFYFSTNCRSSFAICSVRICLGHGIKIC